MEKLDQFLLDIGINSNIALEDVPDIDLYMDQVIQLFEKKFNGSKRNDEEKVLTKTMINNYAKGKLLFPIKNKKYSRNHILILSLIYQLKGALSIGDIKETLEQVNNAVVGDKEFDLETFYQSYLKLSAQNTDMFKSSVKVLEDCVESETTDKGGEDLERVLFIISLAQMSNYYRRAAERMIDMLVEEKE